MKSKNIKVAYSTNYSQRGSDAVPKIQMEGKWLKELGFFAGSTVTVEYEEGSIRIRPLTEEEQTIHKQQILQAELKKKSAELNLLGKEYEYISKVAEAASIYNSTSHQS